MSKPTIVCLCGSTRFSEAFHEANLHETLAGRIVLSIGCDFKSDTDLLLAGELTEQDKIRLDELHLRKIDLADEILVLNVGGYTGQSTKREIAYAREHGKRIRWLEQFPDECPEQGGLPEVWFKEAREQAMQAAGPRARAYIEKLENIAQLADDFWTKLNRRAMSPEEHQLSEALLDALSVVNFLAENDEAYLDEEAGELPRDVIFR